MTVFSQTSTEEWMSTTCLRKVCLTSVSPQATERKRRCWSPRVQYSFSQERFDHDLVGAHSNPDGITYDPFLNLYFWIKITTLNTDEWITWRRPQVNPWSKVIHFRVTGGFQPCEKFENLCCVNLSMGHAWRWTLDQTIFNAWSRHLPPFYLV